MTATSDLAPLLARKPVTLIVEDRLTKEYMLHAWGADQVNFNVLAAGSHQVVKASVTDFRKHGLGFVFGLVDGDFEATNSARWNAVQDPPDILRLGVHEVENYLLDWEALEGCDLNQNNHKYKAASIQQWGETEAAKQVSWLACKRMLRVIQKAHGEDFPKEPKIPNITSVADAESYIWSHPWVQDLPNRTRQIMDRARLHSDLLAFSAEHQQALSDGSWRTMFSGKEVFMHLVSRIYGVPKTLTTTADVDLAISVGKWQCGNGRVPAEVAAIRDSLKTRMGL